MAQIDFGVRIKYPSGLELTYHPTPEQEKEALKLMDEGKKAYEAFDIVMKSKDQSSPLVKTPTERQIRLMKQFKYLLRKAKAWKAKQSQPNPTEMKNIGQK